MRRLAASCRSWARATLDVELDFTPASVIVLDSVCRRMRGRGRAADEETREFARMAGAYCGEVVRRSRPATWRTGGPDGELQLVLPGQPPADPVGRALQAATHDAEIVLRDDVLSMLGEADDESRAASPPSRARRPGRPAVTVPPIAPGDAYAARRSPAGVRAVARLPAERGTRRETAAGDEEVFVAFRAVAGEARGGLGPQRIGPSAYLIAVLLVIVVTVVAVGLIAYRNAPP